METLLRPFPSPLTPHSSFFQLNSPFLNPTTNNSPIKVHHRNKSSRNNFCSFLDLAPTSKPESLQVNISWVDPNLGRALFDVIIIGAGPAGLRLAEQVSKYGVKVCCVDPSPLSMWPNNYGVWVDEFEKLGLEDCLDHKWPMTCVHINDDKTKYLDRPYGRVSRKKLKLKLLSNCIENGVKFYKAKVWNVEHQEFESSIVCDDGRKIRGSLIVDASGFATPFIKYKKKRNHGYQIAHGILAEVDNHPFDLNKMVLMDWRDDHLGNEPYLRVNNNKEPTFLYAMPFDRNLVFLEETSLVSRPILSYIEVKKRMVARLRHLGIKVTSVIEDEKCVIPMGGPLPLIPQKVMATGGNSGIVHPSTGYMVARSMALAPILAEAIVEGLGSTRMIRGSQLYQRVWNGLWPLERRCVRECYSFGMETLLKLDLKGTRRLFDAFFDLDPKYWQGFLSSRLSPKELGILSLSLFGHASNLTRYFVVANAIASAYLVLSLPFSIVCIVRPRLVGPRLLLLTLDTVMVAFTTAAAAAAAAIVYLAHNGNSNTNWLAICQQFDDFCKRVSGAVVASFIAALIFIFLVIFSALALPRH